MSLNHSEQGKNNTKRSYSDEQVLTAVISEQPYSQLVLKWFFQNVKKYALGYWRKKYGRLRDEEWEVIFANTNLKFITRIKNGLVLQSATSLKTYYTSVLGYAILDFLERKKERKYIPSIHQEFRESTPATEQLEKAQLANLVKETLERITGNAEQVKVIILFTKGYNYKEIVEKTSYKSEGACRNAFLKGKKKISEYIVTHPSEGKRLRAMILGNDR